jgi:hypothetical protein
MRTKNTIELQRKLLYFEVPWLERRNSVRAMEILTAELPSIIRRLWKYNTRPIFNALSRFM